jgi:hypothetical protein
VCLTQYTLLRKSSVIAASTAADAVSQQLLSACCSLLFTVGGGHGGQTANDNGQASVTTMKEAQELLRAHDVGTYTNTILLLQSHKVLSDVLASVAACSHKWMPAEHTLAYAVCSAFGIVCLLQLHARCTVHAALQHCTDAVHCAALHYNCTHQHEQYL